MFADEKCRYQYDPNKTLLEWTAFKFTEKTGVKGTFKQIKVKKTKQANNILDAVKDLSFEISADSVDSYNPDRDMKIKNLFFGSIQKSGTIKGSFQKISGTDSGNATLSLQFGKKSADFPVTFKIIDNQLEVSGTIDVLALGLANGLQKLNEACLELHKGKDGVSKLWPTVDVKVVSKFEPICK
ncbi:YceI-like domain protein [Leptospira ryugenii]|uniref:YceI-like domain protein n=2 Tax=Leptospira ryugenii TaxID=1917863 RepID=A0A2P2E2P1_9LEPT|nr:YceI-like domain protein [Leptospira ryugenii]